MPDITTRCCVVGGGPAGMMLGFLLARAGIDVVVLEKHADFLRDFRGDTVHPSTMEVMHELGILDAFLARPAQRNPHARRADRRRTFLQVADFSHLADTGKVHCVHAAMGLPRLHRGPGEPLSDVPTDDAVPRPPT